MDKKNARLEVLGQRSNANPKVPRPILHNIHTQAQKTHLANRARARASLILQPPENSLKKDRAT